MTRTMPPLISEGRLGGGARHLSFMKPKPYQLSELADIAAQLRMGFDPDPALAGATEAPLVGRVLAHEVQPGLFATGFDVELATDLVLSETVEPSLMCGVHRYGFSTPMMVDGHGGVWFEPGRVMLLGLGAPSHCAGRTAAGLRYSFVGCTIKAEFFARFAPGSSDDAVRRLERMIEGGVSVTSYPCSPILFEAAERSLNNPYEGVLADLYVEGCALAQIAEVARIADDGAGRRQSPSLNRRQRDRVYRAREILDHRIADPPSMRDLSKEVGINATSLRAEFQKAYGISVFGYVREQRLQLARALLKTEDLQVSTIGYRVGFGNPAAFATAYRRRFGHSPRQDQAASQARL